MFVVAVLAVPSLGQPSKDATTAAGDGIMEKGMGVTTGEAATDGSADAIRDDAAMMEEDASMMEEDAVMMNELVVSGQRMIGQVLSSAKVLSDGIEVLRTQNAGHPIGEVLKTTEKISANYETISTSERHLFENALVSLNQAAFNLKIVRNHLRECASDTVSRSSSILNLLRKTLPARNLRMQQTGIKLTVRKIKQMFAADIAQLSKLTTNHAEYVENLKHAQADLMPFTAVLTQMADENGLRYKTMHASWKKTYHKSTFVEKIATYWKYVRSTLTSLNTAMSQVGDLIVESDAHEEYLTTLQPTLMLYEAKLDHVYTNYKSSPDYSQMIEGKISLEDVEGLIKNARGLASVR